jgi:hypothetical protein
MIDADPAALTAAATIAEALTDPNTVARDPGNPHNRPQSLAGGAVGIALLHIERARTGHGDEATAHAWLTEAISQPLSTGPNANLFHGAPALGFALHAADQPRHHTALAAIDDHIAAITRTRLAAAQQRIGLGERLRMREFDLIHGLTGLGIYHLRRHPDEPITRDVLVYLARLTQPQTGVIEAAEAADLPAWWITDGLSSNPDPIAFPDGHGNLGMAHGMSAVIAVLALAVLSGVAPAGTRDALAELCAWTDRWRQDTDTAPWWPGYITYDNARTRQIARTQRPRPSWCYGIAGTSRAQQLAGLALGDPAQQYQAEAAMLALLRDRGQRARLNGIGLCHGKAGLLQSAWRMGETSRNPELAAELPGLAADLATQLSEAEDGPDLMDGTAGAALALHTIGSATAPAAGWDAFLALA